MKPSSALLTLLTAAALSSCASSPEKEARLTLPQYEEMLKATPLKATKFKVSYRIIDEKGTSQSSPSVTVKKGVTAQIDIAKDVIYPTAFDTPQTLTRVLTTARTPGAFPVTPTTPTAFTTRSIGTQFEVTVVTTGPFVQISGTYAESTYKMTPSGAGEAASPIYDSTGRILLTENKVQLPVVSQTDHPFYIAGLPGKEHTITLPSGKKLSIQCDPLP